MVPQTKVNFEHLAKFQGVRAGSPLHVKLICCYMNINNNRPDEINWQLEGQGADLGSSGEAPQFGQATKKDGTAKQKWEKKIELGAPIETNRISKSRIRLPVLL
jgi:hypothetical protein